MTDHVALAVWICAVCAVLLVLLALAIWLRVDAVFPPPSRTPDTTKRPPTP